MEKQKSFLEWENTHTHQISAYHHTKEDGYKEELLILKYNLDDKSQKKYQYMYQEVNNTLFWNCHPEYTEDLYPPDTGVVNQIRFWFGVHFMCIFERWAKSQGMVNCYSM